MAIQIDIETSTIVINGVTITGFSEESDALTLPEIELAQEKYGADGRMIVTATGTKGGRVIYKLLATSPSITFLSSLAEQMKAGAQLVLSGTVTSNTTGAGVTMSNGRFVTYQPFPTLGKGEISSMSYTIAYETVTGVFEAANLG